MRFLAPTLIPLSLAIACILGFVMFFYRDTPSSATVRALPDEPQRSPSSKAVEPAPINTATKSPVDTLLPELPSNTHNWDYLSHALRRGNEHITIIEKPDGTLQADLNGGYQSATAARIGEDGRIVISCFHDFESIQEFLLYSDTPKRQVSPPKPQSINHSEQSIVYLEK
jgi:hypothetical protein